ncbi:MAG TPA: hypothetical protein VF003_04455 [Pseudonocardiaceae bacterium]
MIAGLTGDAYTDPVRFLPAFQVGIWIYVGLLAAGSVVAVLTIRNTRVALAVIESSRWCMSASLGSRRLRRRDRRTPPEGA